MSIDRIKNVISEMSLEEKVALCGCGADLVTRAIPRLKVSGVKLPLALITTRANLAALGCTFSLELAAEYGKILSAESIVRGTAIGGVLQLGIIREPMTQGSETFLGEDAYYVGEMANAIVDGSSTKLLAGGILGGEYKFSERWMDARAILELYMRPFLKVADKLGGAVIPAGSLNGEMCAGSKWFVSRITDYLNSGALIVNEFGSIVSRSAAVAAGASYQIVDNVNDSGELFKSINSGYMFERLLDDNLERLLKLVWDNNTTVKSPQSIPEIDEKYEINLCEKSVVLLKNDNELPMISGNKISVFGDITKAECSLMSGEIDPIYGKAGGNTAVVFLKLEGESYTHAQISLVYKTIDTYKRVIVVLLASRPAPLPFESGAAAIFYVPATSQYAYSTIAKMLVGKLNPCGKLNCTYAYQVTDYPANSYPMAKGRGMFCYESVMSGYRYFNEFSRNCLYPFGHGLSYTGFEISKLKCSFENEEISVDFVVKNVGMLAGDSTVMVFGCLPYENIFGLKSRLMAFKRVSLGRGENVAVHLKVKASEISVFDAANNEWLVPGGKLEIFAGLSATDRRVSTVIKVPHATRYNLGLGCKVVPSYYTDGVFNPLGADVEKVMGVPLIVKEEPVSKICAPALGQDSVKSVKLAAKKFCKMSGLNLEEATASIEELSKFAIDKINHFL